MSIFWLNERLAFPHHEFATKEGILALGGDLSFDRLLLAYSNGIFPWYNENDPIIWWSPKERFVLYLDSLRIASSLKKFLKRNPYTVTFDTQFESVIDNCRKLRQESGTWITREMQEAYIDLHYAGVAHSVEVWHEGNLVGGLYGVSLGKYFSGESMFTLMNNASKVALIELCSKLKQMGFVFMDCQVHSPHIEKMGGINIPRKNFHKELRLALSKPTIASKWHFLNQVD